MSSTGLQNFKENIRNLPRGFWDSWIRQGPLVSARNRSLAVFSNLWLHLHSTRIHPRTLKFSTTMGLGIGSLASFLILVATGILLMVYYKPGLETAYESMKDIHYVVPTGRFLRNIHRWGAHVMVVLVILHMCRVFFTAAYKKPREFNWLIGMGLFVLTLGLSFTGYLLPWDQLAYWAVVIGSNIAGSPTELTDAMGVTQYFDPGQFARLLLLGSNSVGQEALIRFYLLHCVVLPLAITGLIGLHFWRIRKDGGLAKPEEQTAAGKGADPVDAAPSAPKDAPRKSFGLMAIVRDRTEHTNVNPDETISSWPYLLRAELLVFMVVMLILVVLGIFFDAPLKELANPTIPENPAKAPWYFLGLQEMVSYSAFMGGMIIPMIVVIGLALVPYLDKEKEEAGVYLSDPRGKRVALRSLLFGAVAAILAVAVPVNFGWLRNWIPNIPQIFIILINPGTLLTLAYAWWSLHVLKREQSTRMSAIALFTCFLVGFVILTWVGTYLRGPNWDFYWSQAYWPNH